jgi:hypothetical protein
MAPSALSHGDGAPSAGAQDCIPSARRFWRVELVSRRSWVDILLDVIGGVESALWEGCPGTTSTLVLGAFSTGVFQHHCITPH